MQTLFYLFYNLMNESNNDVLPLAGFSLSCNEPRPVWTLFKFLNNYPWYNYARFIIAAHRCMNSLLQNANSLRIGKNICLHIYNIRIIAGLKKLHPYITTVLLFFPHSKQDTHFQLYIYMPLKTIAIQRKNILACCGESLISLISNYWECRTHFMSRHIRF